MLPSHKPRVYLAGPLFSEPERIWCRNIKVLLENGAGVEVLWPGAMVEAELERVLALPPLLRQVAIAEICRKGIDACDIFVALLDTIPSDDGTAWEMGYLRGSRSSLLPIFGLRTDAIRAYGDSAAPLNAMLGAHIFLAGKLCTTVYELVEAVRLRAEYLS